MIVQIRDSYINQRDGGKDRRVLIDENGLRWVQSRRGDWNLSQHGKIVTTEIQARRHEHLLVFDHNMAEYALAVVQNDLHLRCQVLVKPKPMGMSAVTELIRDILSGDVYANRFKHKGLEQSDIIEYMQDLGVITTLIGQCGVDLLMMPESTNWPEFCAALHAAAPTSTDDFVTSLNILCEQFQFQDKQLDATLTYWVANVATNDWELVCHIRKHYAHMFCQEPFTSWECPVCGTPNIHEVVAGDVLQDALCEKCRSVINGIVKEGVICQKS
jgi:hypothetical protein